MVTCPVLLDSEVGEYIFRNSLPQGYYCRLLAEESATVEVRPLSPYPFTYTWRRGTFSASSFSLLIITCHADLPCPCYRCQPLPLSPYPLVITKLTIEIILFSTGSFTANKLQSSIIIIQKWSKE